MSAPLAALPQLPAQSQVAGFDKTLRVRAKIRDVYVGLDGMYNRAQEAIPNAVYMKVDEKAMAGSNNVTITMKLPLIGPPNLGNNRLTQTEEAPRTKAAKIYRNNYSKAVRIETYGVRQLDQEPYGLYSKHVNELGDWFSEFEGLEIRQAGLETFGMSLWFGDTAAICQPVWNPNFFVQNCPRNLQPVWNSNLTVYTNNIVNSIISAGGFAQSNPQAATFQLMNSLGLEAIRRRLFPLNIGGNHAYILMVSQLQAVIYGDPTWSANTGGAVWIQRNQLPDKVQNWHGIIGKFQGSGGVDIYVVVDYRCPSLIPSGTSEPFGLTAGYVWPGDEDRRNHDNPHVRDACILLGQGAICRWNAQKLHNVTQPDDYGRIEGHGAAGVRGIQLVRYDQQNSSATSLEYRGSMVVVMARPNYY